MRAIGSLTVMAQEKDIELSGQFALVSMTVTVGLEAQPTAYEVVSATR